MKQSFLINLLIIGYIQTANLQCLNVCSRINSTKRGNYLNVLNYHNGDLISSKNKNQFNDYNDGSPFRDEIYLVTSYFGFLMCSLGQSIQINLIQKYELNTLKIWLWDRTNRFYTIEVFIIFENVETRIYESNQAQSILTIQFPAQKVESFRIYNTGGNTVNSILHIIKVEAYYKFQ
ncbi:unnamed protein product [Paramecium primaurelia]|uniref:Uncharacterized protein n=1 Tax=Paramecium primaurelia TaxID=5886 RepID=A0A8S1PS52_PARPR|nr:unnamed protein product [Paramecium primaurelia]